MDDPIWARKRDIALGVSAVGCRRTLSWEAIKDMVNVCIEETQEHLQPDVQDLHKQLSLDSMYIELR